MTTVDAPLPLECPGGRVEIGHSTEGTETRLGQPLLLHRLRPTERGKTYHDKTRMLEVFENTKGPGEVVCRSQ